METPLALNLDLRNGAAFRSFIQRIRDETGWHIVELLQRGFVVHPAKRTDCLGHVRAEDWVFTVSLVHQGESFEIAIQRYRAYVVGFKVPNKEWIVFDGEHPQRVIDCLNTSFPVLDEDGNRIPPLLASLGTSYHSLETNGSGVRKDLKLNINSLINAVRGLTDAYPGIVSGIVSNDNTIPVGVAKFVLTLIQMIPEAVRIEPMLSFICNHYTTNDLTTPYLPTYLITLQGSWTKVSRAVARTSYGFPFKEIRLRTGHRFRTVEEATAMFPYLRGITLGELIAG